jgi:hypothetical protein
LRFSGQDISRWRRDIAVAYILRYEYREGYLFVHMKGPESYDSACQFWKDLRKEGDARKYTRFLIVDEVTGVLNRAQVYRLSTEIAKIHFGNTIAYVDPKEETFDANAFGETVVNDQGGVNARLFKNETDAIEWLSKIIINA